MDPPQLAPNQRIWRIADEMANKTGMRSTIFFSGGVKYAGEWDHNMREGKGTQEYPDHSRYDGSWKGGKRHGHGLFLVPATGTTATASRDDDLGGGNMRLVYSGDWVDDRMEGYGTYFYENGEQYEGEWLQNKRSGFGTMYYQDGTRYVGHWENGLRVGQGTLYKADGNRYEGAWADDQQHGSGVFYYPPKHRKYVGEWVQGVPKCGVYQSEHCVPNPPPGLLPPGGDAVSARAAQSPALPPPSEDSIRKPSPALPALQLAEPDKVLGEAVMDSREYGRYLEEVQQRERDARAEQARIEAAQREEAEALERAKLSQQARALAKQ
ncbi:putative MORN motif protein [Paratrimastix pyriformis]|uniref:MORN repeat-containing protein 3 n=1 Tax=Paratrimastix pyriformis TaxID=342808 RepID=A0ABQ8UV72_9EUKA|nr:putative MORN motif protein [Paratrimastix pyriformis]